jgi:hypothetical protein
VWYIYSGGDILKVFFIDLLKYLIKVFLATLIISAIGYLISIKFNHILSEVYFYIGLTCFLVGGGAIIGKHDTSNYQADSVSTRNFNQVIRDNLNLRNNFSFLLFMIITGVIMLTLSHMLNRYI